MVFYLPRNQEPNLFYTEMARALNSNPGVHCFLSGSTRTVRVAVNWLGSIIIDVGIRKKPGETVSTPEGAMRAALLIRGASGGPVPEVELDAISEEIF